jgi:4-hydroxy 2-oxovalerate aldolase
MHTLSLRNILDVTLRDGGYLNHWDFSVSEVFSFLTFLNNLGLRNVEVGFLRTPDKTTSLVNGCPAEFLAQLKQNYPQISLVGMLNPEQPDFEAAITGKLSYLSMIRLPCTTNSVLETLAISEFIRQQNIEIKISLNLICASSYAEYELRQILEKIAMSQVIDILYLADSRGALLPNQVEKILTLAREYWVGDMGFHAHDTQGNAIQNSNRAVQCGCQWIDVSLNGFGLAGGNTSLVNYLDSHGLIDIEENHTETTPHLPLQHPNYNIRQIYTTLAQKNVDPVWTDCLVKRYGTDLNTKIESLPYKYYKDIESVFSEIENHAINFV